MSKEFKYRFFKGEKTNPFDSVTDFSRYVFWNEEKFHSNLPDVEQKRMRNIYREALAENSVTRDLANTDIPENERAVLFFCDLHYGHIAPYDYPCVDWNLYFASTTSPVAT